MKLNLGCGNKKLPVEDGWINIDQSAICQPDMLMVLSVNYDWPWPDGSVEEINAAHVLEHLTYGDLLFVMCEAYRVLQPGGRFTIEVPHPRSDYFLGDPTHQTPITENTLNLFSRKLCEQWKKDNVSNTPLALYLGIDFNLVHNEVGLNPEWKDVLLEPDGVTIKNERYFRHAIATFNNVIHNLKFVLERKF